MDFPRIKTFLVISGNLQGTEQSLAVTMLSLKGPFFAVSLGGLKVWYLRLKGVICGIVSDSFRLIAFYYGVLSMLFLGLLSTFYYLLFEGVIYVFGGN